MMFVRNSRQNENAATAVATPCWKIEVTKVTSKQWCDMFMICW